MSFYEDHAGRLGSHSEQRLPYSIGRPADDRMSFAKPRSSRRPADGVITSWKPRPGAVDRTQSTGFSSTIVIVTNSSGIATICESGEPR